MLSDCCQLCCFLFIYSLCAGKPFEIINRYCRDSTDVPIPVRQSRQKRHYCNRQYWSKKSSSRYAVYALSQDLIQLWLLVFSRHFLYICFIRMIFVHS